MKHSKTKSKPPKPAPDFPVLRCFFSGYLHQDFRDEYDSPAAAAAAFCSEASPQEIAAVRSEWIAWRKGLAGASAPEVAAAIRKLGGVWAPQAESELAALEQAINTSTV
jgi:hypothetical protein